jgi:hypothetical protein
MPTVNEEDESKGWKAIAESNRDANEEACKTVWALTAERKEIYKKILAAREAYIKGDMDEVWHQLYLIADPKCENLQPWEQMEKIVNQTEF